MDRVEFEPVSFEVLVRDGHRNATARKVTAEFVPHGLILDLDPPLTIAPGSRIRSVGESGLHVQDDELGEWFLTLSTTAPKADSIVSYLRSVYVEPPTQGSSIGVVMLALLPLWLSIGAYALKLHEASVVALIGTTISILMLFVVPKHARFMIVGTTVGITFVIGLFVATLDWNPPEAPLAGPNLPVQRNPRRLPVPEAVLEQPGMRDERFPVPEAIFDLPEMRDKLLEPQIQPEFPPTLTPLRTWKAPRAERIVRQGRLAFSPDGKRLIYAGQGRDPLWLDPSNAQPFPAAEIVELDDVPMPMDLPNFIFTPDGSHVLVWTAGSKSARLMETATGNAVRRLRWKETPIGTDEIAFLPDGGHLLIATGRALKLFCLADKNVVTLLPASANVLGVQHAAGDKYTLLTVEIDARKQAIYHTEWFDARTGAVDPDSRRPIEAYRANSQVIRHPDLPWMLMNPWMQQIAYENGTAWKYLSVPQMEGKFGPMSMTANGGRMYGTSTNGTVYLWDTTIQPPELLTQKRLLPRPDPTRGFTVATLSPDGQYLACADEAEIRLFETRKVFENQQFAFVTPPKDLPAPAAWVTTAMASASSPNVGGVAEVPVPQKPRFADWTFSKGTLAPGRLRVSLSPNGSRMVITDSRADVCLVDPSMRKVIEKFSAVVPARPDDESARMPARIAFAPDGSSFVAYASDSREMIVRRTTDGEVLQTLRLRSGNQQGMIALSTVAVYGPDASKLYVPLSPGVFEFTVATGRSIVRPVEGINSPIAFPMADGSRLQAKQIRTATGKHAWQFYMMMPRPETTTNLRQIEGSSSLLMDSIYSPDARYLARLTSDGRITGFDLLDESEAFEFSAGPQRSFAAFAFTPDGTEIIAIDNTGTLSRWSLADRKRTATVATPVAMPNEGGMAISADGTSIAVVGAGRVRFWSVVSLFGTTFLTAK